MKTSKIRILLLIAIPLFLSFGSQAQGLYVGTNYHPHDDKNIEKIKKGPEVPTGVMARQIDKNHYLYLNISGEPKEIPLKGKAKSILFDKNYDSNFKIAPYEPEFIETK